MPPAEIALTRRDAGSWLPWISLPAVAGAAGLVPGTWWWMAPLAALLVVGVARWWPWAARLALAWACLAAGSTLAPPPPPTAAPPRLWEVTGTVNAVITHGWRPGLTLEPDAGPGYRPARLWVRAPGEVGLRPGDRISVRGRWYLDERGPRLEAVDVQRLVAREEGPRGWAWRVIDRCERHRELAGALLLGRGDPPDKAAFRRTGLLHILAVSGMHLVIAAGLMAWVLRQMGMSWQIRLTALAVLMCGYTWLTGASPATIRALAMGLAVVAYDACGREPTRLGPLAAAVLALLVIDPSCAADLGFQLSLLAVLGILTLGADLRALRAQWLPLAPWPLDRPTWRLLLAGATALVDGLAIGIAATVATAPLLIATFGTIAPFGVITALVASPPATVALWAGLPLIGLAGLWPEGPWEGLYRLVEGALDALVLAVHGADGLPGQLPVAMPGPLTLIVGAIAMMAPLQGWWWWPRLLVPVALAWAGW